MYANDLKALRDKKKQALEFDVEQADVIITMYELIKRYETIHKKSLKETSAYTRGQYLRKYIINIDIRCERMVLIS